MSHRRVRHSADRAKRGSAADPASGFGSAPTIALGCLLVTATLILYSPVRTHTFINYDDTGYVVSNSHVNSGLSSQTVRWALTSTEQCNWHPVTWLSHALQYQLFETDAGYHHLTSAVLHSLNTLLLFVVLQRATGALVRSFIVAALFAWHPFNVQSVAWVAEQKNLLCTFFFLLTLAAYGWYERQPQLKSFVVVAGVFVLALAAKPMAVTLPFVLLLLDYWPLQRIAGWIEPRPDSVIPQKPFSRLLLEKLPLFALSAMSSVITVWAQRSCGAWRSLKKLPLNARLENALFSYLVYIWKTLWPSNFGLFYLHPGTLPIWKPALAVAVLCAIGMFAWRLRVSRPYLMVGFLWFLGTLFPMIGVVQVGDQAMADRYAYLPIIGLFAFVVWGVTDFFELAHVRKEARWASALIVLAILWLRTSKELSYWEDSVKIWSHTLEVTGSPQAEKPLAMALAAQGESGEAIVHFLNVVKFDPTDIAAHVNLGAYYASQGRLRDGIQEFESAVKLTEGNDANPEDISYRWSALLDLGFAYALAKDYPRALVSLHEASQSNPAFVDQTIQAIDHSLGTLPTEDSYLKLSLLLRAQGRNPEAASILEDAIKAYPHSVNLTELQEFMNTSM